MARNHLIPMIAQMLGLNVAEYYNITNESRVISMKRKE
jgi:hypothetical protein